MSIFDKLKRKNKDVGYWESKLGVEGGFRQYNGRDMRSDCKIKNVKKIKIDLIIVIRKIVSEEVSISIKLFCTYIRLGAI